MKTTKKATLIRSPNGTKTSLARRPARQNTADGPRQPKRKRKRLGTSFCCLDCGKTYIACKCKVYQSEH